MKNKNGGFSLLELLIAVAVLSVMAAALPRFFLLAGRMERESRQQEMIQNTARQTLEEMRGISFTELDRKLGTESEEPRELSVTAAASRYACSREEDGGICLTRRSRDGEYLIRVLAEGGENGVYEADNVGRPLIGDIINHANIVLEPGTALRAWEAMEARREEEAAKADDTEDPDADSEEVWRSLVIHAGETGNGRLSLSVRLLLTPGDPDTCAEAEAAAKDTEEILSEERTAFVTEEGCLRNRIYIFLPEQMELDRVFLSGKMEHPAEVYLIFGQGGFGPEHIIIEDKPAPVYEGKDFRLYTNLGGWDLVARAEPENRLYRLRVTVLEAEYPEGPDGPAVPGRERFSLESAKEERAGEVGYEGNTYGQKLPEPSRERAR